MQPCMMNDCMQLPYIHSILSIHLVYLRTSCYLSYTQSHCSHFECELHNMGSASRRQKWCSRIFNTVSKQKAAIARWNSTRNISQQSTTQHPGNPFYKTLVLYFKKITQHWHINIGVVNEVPTRTGEDPITVDTTNEYYTSVISLSYNSQSRQWLC